MKKCRNNQSHPRTLLDWNGNLNMVVREAFKNYLADFSVKGVTPPPPTPLTENHFAKELKLMFLY